MIQMSQGPQFSVPFGQPENVFTRTQVDNGVKIPAVFPRSGQGSLERVIIEGRDCVVKRYDDGNIIDDKYPVPHGGALTYLAGRVQGALSIKNLKVVGPDVLYQDDGIMVTASVTAGHTPNLALNLNQAMTKLWSKGKLYDEVLAYYGKEPALPRPFDPDMRGLLIDFMHAHNLEVRAFNALLKNNMSPRGEVATPVDTHFVVPDFTITPAGAIEIKIVLMDLR